MTDHSVEQKEQQSDSRGLDITAAETSWGFKGRNYLLIIGIDDYKIWRPLHCAVKDVQDFTRILTENYQFEEEFVFPLLNENATVQNVLRIIRELAQIITDQDNLLIYFSGHGHYDDVTKTGYWIPVDAPIGNEHQHQFIDTTIIVDRLRKINSLHTFLIVDACFSGTILFKGRGECYPKSERYKSRIVFASGRCEVVSDGPKGGNSPFAKGLLDILKMNTNSCISASRLIVEVQEYVAKQADQSPVDGRLHGADDQGGDFTFRLKMSEAEIWASVVHRLPSPMPHRTPTSSAGNSGREISVKRSTRPILSIAAETSKLNSQLLVKIRNTKLRGTLKWTLPLHRHPLPDLFQAKPNASFPVQSASLMNHRMQHPSAGILAMEPQALIKIPRISIRLPALTRSGLSRVTTISKL